MIQLPHTLIRAIINNVVETFATTPVTYHLAKAASKDRFGEGENKMPTDIVINGFVEYGTDDIQQDMRGSINPQGIKIMFKSEDWEAAGLYLNGEIKANESKDHLTVNGRYYKVDAIIPNGAFEIRNLIIMVMASLEARKS